MTYTSIEMISPATGSTVHAEVAPRTVARSSRNIVRPLEEGDLDGVARLFLSRFRGKRAASNERACAEVANYMRQLYFEGPGLRCGRCIAGPNQRPWRDRRLHRNNQDYLLARRRAAGGGDEERLHGGARRGKRLRRDRIDARAASMPARLDLYGFRQTDRHCGCAER